MMARANSDLPLPVGARTSTTSLPAAKASRMSATARSCAPRKLGAGNSAGIRVGSTRRPRALAELNPRLAVVAAAGAVEADPRRGSRPADARCAEAEPRPSKGAALANGDRKNPFAGGVDRRRLLRASGGVGAAAALAGCSGGGNGRGREEAEALPT